MARTAADKARHRKFAVDCFNGTWKLMEKKRRSKEEDERMVHMAHASRYHWSVAGTPGNRAVGDWQLSRVYLILKRSDSAMHYAKMCLETCRRAGLRDFFLAYAYEALARACVLAGQRRDARRFLVLARKAGTDIEDAEDRKLLARDLATIRA